MMLRLQVKELAEARGFGISRLARETGEHISTIRRYWHNQTDQGKPLPSVQLSTLDAIARALGVKPSALVSDE